MASQLSLVDTGVLVAAAVRSEPQHDQVVAALQSTAGIRLVPSPVIVEAIFLIRRARGSEAAARWLRCLLAADSGLAILEPEIQDLSRAAELMDEYVDASLDLVDAVIVALAERMRINRILTLDQRDFRLVRPRHCDAFDILPHGLS